jgi:hypothetical protein
MTVTPEWPVPFRGRHHSGATRQNFLWRQGNVFIMDNHRAALWCWLQCIDTTEMLGLFHIDEHFDCLDSRLAEWRQALPPLEGLSIDAYLDLKFRIGRDAVPIIQWDNYLSLFLEIYKPRIAAARFATHGVGDKPKFENATFVEPQYLNSNLEDIADSKIDRWLINVDLDYFFCAQGDTQKPMFSEDYLQGVLGTIAGLQSLGKVACLTISMSPDEELTGGWEAAEALCARVCTLLDVPFVLPPAAHA